MAIIYYKTKRYSQRKMETERRTLDPFGDIAAQKYASHILIEILAGRNAEVTRAVAGCGVGNLVVQRLPLIGNAIRSNRFSGTALWRILNLHHLQKLFYFSRLRKVLCALKNQVVRLSARTR